MQSNHSMSAYESTVQRLILELSTRFQAAGIGFAITSGQACVHYGMQQTTKDVDYIVHPGDLDKLRTLLSLPAIVDSYRAGYRAVCGAPLEAAFLEHGWTSHLVLQSGSGNEQHLDFFGKPPLEVLLP